MLFKNIFEDEEVIKNILNKYCSHYFNKKYYISIAFIEETDFRVVVASSFDKDLLDGYIEEVYSQDVNPEESSYINDVTLILFRREGIFSDGVNIIDNDKLKAEYMTLFDDGEVQKEAKERIKKYKKQIISKIDDMVGYSIAEMKKIIQDDNLDRNNYFKAEASIEEDLIDLFKNLFQLNFNMSDFIFAYSESDHDEGYNVDYSNSYDVGLDICRSIIDRDAGFMFYNLFDGCSSDISNSYEAFVSFIDEPESDELFYENTLSGSHKENLNDILRKAITELNNMSNHFKSEINELDKDNCSQDSLEQIAMDFARLFMTCNMFEIFNIY